MGISWSKIVQAALPDAMPAGKVRCRFDSGGVTAQWFDSDGADPIKVRVVWRELEQQPDDVARANLIANRLVNEVWLKLHGPPARMTPPAPMPPEAEELEIALDNTATRAAVAQAVTKSKPMTNIIAEAKATTRIVPAPPLPEIGPVMEYDLMEFDAWVRGHGVASTALELSRAVRTLYDFDSLAAEVLTATGTALDCIESARIKLRKAMGTETVAELNDRLNSLTATIEKLREAL